MATTRTQPPARHRHVCRHDGGSLGLPAVAIVDRNGRSGRRSRSEIAVVTPPLAHASIAVLPDERRMVSLSVCGEWEAGVLADLLESTATALRRRD